MAIDQLASFRVAPSQSIVPLDPVTGRAQIAGPAWSESFTLSNTGVANLYLQTAATSGNGAGIILEPGRNASFPSGNSRDVFVEGAAGGSCVVTFHDEA